MQFLCLYLLPHGLRRAGRSRVRHLLTFVAFVIAASSSEANNRRNFEIPAGEAGRTLRIFSQQSGEQIIYPVEELRGLRTEAVNGRMTAGEALAKMLERSGLGVVQDEASGALVVKRERSDSGRKRDADAQTGLSPGASSPPAAGYEGDVVVLSPFEVRSRADNAYRAANSVSGTRIAVPLRHLPMTITAFTDEFIRDQKAYDLYDIVKWAPGVHQDNVSPQGWIRYNIRGFTSAAVQHNGFESYRFVDTTNIARVEVVKGPASLLYGQINPGGVINYITKRSEPKPALELTTSIGDYNYRRAVLDATGPVPGTGGKLLYRAILMGEEIQRFQVRTRGHKTLFAPSATWKISDRAALTVDYEHFARREQLPSSGVVLLFDNGVGTSPYPGVPWNFNYAGKGDYQNYVSDTFTAEFSGEVGDHLILRGVYVDTYWDHDWRATGQGGTGLLAQSFINAYYPPSAGLTPADAMFRRNRREHQWGGNRAVQVDLTGTFHYGGITLRPLVGYKAKLSLRYNGKQWNNPNIAGHPYYLKPWDLRNPATWDNAVPFGETALVLAGDSSTSSDGSAVYAILSASAFEDRLHLFGGYARHRDQTNPSRNLLFSKPAPGVDRTASVPQAGVLFEILHGLSGFVSYSESFLANTTMLRVNNVPSIPASPSVGKGTEVGLKGELLAGKISGTLSAYRVQASPTGIITVTGGIDASGNTLFTEVQGGSQLSEGFEADLSFAPTPAWQIIAGFSRCDAIYERHPSDRALDGTPLVATPDKTFSLWGKYRCPGVFEGLTLAGGLNYVGSMPYVGNNPFLRLPAYTTIDLAFGYRFAVRDREWTVDLSIKNLANERYYASRSSWGFPRHMILSVGVRF